MGTGGIPVEQQVASVADRLVRDYAGQVPESVVRDLVTQAWREYAQARVQHFIPVLVDRSVRQRLRGAVAA